MLKSLYIWNFVVFYTKLKLNSSLAKKYNQEYVLDKIYLLDSAFLASHVSHRLHHHSPIETVKTQKLSWVDYKARPIILKE